MVIERHTDRDGQTEIHRQTDRHTDRDGQTEIHRQTDRETDRQTDRHLLVWMTIEDRVSNVSWLKPSVGLKKKDISSKKSSSISSVCNVEQTDENKS